MGLYSKAKLHVTDFALNKADPDFIFFRILRIVNRRMPLPKAVFKNLPSEEEYLMKYMVPKHEGCFVDVGANVGSWTFLLAEKGITVHAFEPSPRSYGILKEKAEKYGNVHVYSFALGENNYEAQLHLHQTSGHDSITKREGDYTGRHTRVTVRTLDSFNLRNVGLVKIDTEGYEVPVLLGARKTIVNHKPRLIIEVHRPHNEQAQKITTILKQLNYSWLIRFKGDRIHHLISDPVA